jgi:hypothetical protein
VPAVVSVQDREDGAGVDETSGREWRANDHVGEPAVLSRAS